MSALTQTAYGQRDSDLDLFERQLADLIVSALSTPDPVRRVMDALDALLATSERERG